MERHRKGELTEAIVIAELKRREIPVSTPFGDNERYDVVIETESGDLLRIQIKTGWLSDGKIEFHGSSQHTNSSGNVYKMYDGDVDYFVVYCYELESIYLVSETAFATSMSLRVEEPKRADRSIRWAEDYEFDNRWPIDPSSEEDTESSHCDTVNRVIERFEDVGVATARTVDDDQFDFLGETSEGPYCRVKVEVGWKVEGRIRFNPSSSNEFDYLAIAHDESEKLFVVPTSEYDQTISLRVDEPTQVHDSINWASDYEFPNRWP